MHTADPSGGLTAEQRRLGLRRYRLFFATNGIPVAVLLESVLVLYAIKNGLNDTALAAIASFPFLTMPFLFLGRPLVVRLGLARAWSMMWSLRYVFAGLLLFAPAFRTPQTRTLLFLIGTFGFATCRSVGVINNQPILGDITAGAERGRYMNGNTLRFNVVYGSSLILVTSILRFSDAIITYQVLIASAVVAGLITARIIAGIPETQHARAAASTPLFHSLRETWHDLRLRKLIWAWAAGLSASVLVLTMSLVAVKNGYGVSDGEVMVFLMISVVGSIASAVINQEIADHVGPRPLLIVYAAVFVVVAAFLSVGPPTYHPVLIGVFFFAAGFAKNGINVAQQLYLLSAATVHQRISISMLVESIGGLAAGLSGTVIAGGLFALLGRSMSDLPVYRIYFAVVMFLMLGAFRLMNRLEPLEEWRVRHAAALLASPRTLWAMAVMNRLPNTDVSVRPRTPAEVRNATGQTDGDAETDEPDNG